MVDREIGTRTGWFYCRRCGALFLIDAQGQVIRVVR